MKQHRYRITVEHLELADGSTPEPARTASFEIGNHDDILAIMERVRQRGDIPESESAAFALGLKLFSEVMLQNRSLPIFADFQQHFKAFMQGFKQRPAPASTGE